MTEANHQSYLLRLWRADADTPWRATLIDCQQPHTQQHFATLTALTSFLYEHLSVKETPASNKDVQKEP